MGEAATDDLATFRHSLDVTVESATIDWGDGSAPTAGTVAPVADSGTGGPLLPTPGDLLVSGGHAYARPGLYQVRVTVAGPGGAMAQATLTASVALASAQGLMPAPFLGFTADAAASPTTLARFSAPANATPANFRATVDWGDGSPAEVATVRPEPSSGRTVGTFDVVAGHDYATAGTYTMTVTAVGDDGIPAVATEPIAVAAAATPGQTTASPPTTTMTTTTALPTSPTDSTGPPPTPTASTTAPPVPTPTATATPIPPSALAPTASSFASLPSPIVLPSPFPRFAPIVARHPGSAGHPRSVGHHAAAPTATADSGPGHHGRVRRAHVALGAHPRGPARRATPRR